ncbi:hypothetical protein NDU88_002584 [Pleurodeles waltl]|uniref:Uncharacterized protein n=1 Tax=Pleurodeles waltl TaxID=8319 RepID=A0AAV7MP87_PLEWA|nr:hypothetical protein NDU88_002584 [Pleurodeles waltl]
MRHCLRLGNGTEHQHSTRMQCAQVARQRERRVCENCLRLGNGTKRQYPEYVRVASPRKAGPEGSRCHGELQCCGLKKVNLGIPEAVFVEDAESYMKQPRN